MKSKINASNQKDLLFELVRTNFKLRYQNSVLGIVWVVLKPLITFSILYIVFSRFRGEGIDNYAIYLLLGIMIYNFFSEGIIFGMNSLLDKAHIILKVNFPRQIAVMSSLINAFINFLINTIVLVVFIFFKPVQPTITSLLYFLFIIFVLFMLVYSISFFTSIITVKLRDLSNITEILLQLGFYVTPIIFPITFLPETINGVSWIHPRSLVLLNPMTTIVQSARSALMTGEIINLERILIISVIVIVLLVLGNLYFRREVKRIAESF